MEEVTGVPPSGSGHSPKGGAASASPAKPSVPNADDVDDAVEAWHKGAGRGLGLPEYLGWTAEEYSTWVFHSDAIPQRPLASAIETQSATTAGRGPKDESAVGEAETPEPSSIAPVQDDDAEMRARYEELIFAVSKKHKGESRHETALRYIRERESLAEQAQAVLSRQAGG